MRIDKSNGSAELPAHPSEFPTRLRPDTIRQQASFNTVFVQESRLQHKVSYEQNLSTRSGGQKPHMFFLYVMSPGQRLPLQEI